MTPTELKTLAETALDDMKGVDIQVIDVSDKTTVTDWMIVAGGTSQRHVKSLANEVIRQSKEKEVRPLGTEGETEGDWILVDLGDVIVHVMTRETRDFYSLEKLWTMEPTDRAKQDEEESDGDSQDDDVAAS
ncbi:MAG: ribosome silencing factor [Pseudomonadota bacterium]